MAQHPGRFLLFAPPRPPLALPAGRRVVVGRASSCELALDTPTASRRHAEVFPEAGGYAVRDLGSTNGTFVNGERIGTRSLAPGDVIGIGEQSITFCHLESEAGAPLRRDERTLLFPEAPEERALRGDFAQIPPTGLLQMLELERTSGVLEVQAPSGPARMWITDGHPVHAEVGAERGLRAALTIALLREGRFVLTSGSEPSARTIEVPMTELVLEASRHVDEESPGAATG